MKQFGELFNIIPVPVGTWEVEVEVREQGAIGVFCLAKFRVRAKDSATAITYALGDAFALGFETRSALTPTRIR